MIKLAFAAFWLSAGGLFLYLAYFTDEPPFRLADPQTTRLSGWLALALALYNAVRWWAQRPPRNRAD